MLNNLKKQVITSRQGCQFLTMTKFNFAAQAEKLPTLEGRPVYDYEYWQEKNRSEKYY